MIKKIIKIVKKCFLKDPDIGTHNRADREQWLKKQLEKIPAKNKILDAGAGELYYKDYCSHLNYTSQDFGEYDGKGDAVAFQTGSWDQTKLDIVCDVVSIPREDASFDAIMCIEVLEHIPEPAKAIQEFSRLLRKDGVLIITSPFCSLTHFSPYHFSTGFNKYFYKTILEKNGFDIVEITPNGNYFDYLAQEIRRIPYVAEKYSSSKINFFEKMVLGACLHILDKYKTKDKNSSDLLCFGYGVVAKKK